LEAMRLAQDMLEVEGAYAGDAGRAAQHFVQ
jgi:hypothetical protein